MGESKIPSEVGSWLVLMHQLPAKPEALRVRVWRRLRKLGAIQLKNSAYILPDDPFHRSALENLASDIREDGGDAFLFGASWIQGISDGELRSKHQETLSLDAEPLVKEARQWISRLRRTRRADSMMDGLHVYGKLVSRLRELRARDHFGSTTVDELKGATGRLAQVLFGSDENRNSGQKRMDRKNAWIWVTRKKPGVDRLSSAWLIKRFIDPKAEIRFVDMDLYSHEKDHLRFDVFAGEFTHEEDLCTFEVLIERFGISEPAVQMLGQIIHDLDLEDEKFQRADMEKVRDLLLQSMKSENDNERLATACKHLDSWLAEQA